MFELDSTPATLMSVTPRTEVHGEDRVFAISLGLKITGANTLLDKLTPALRHMIYTAKPDSEPELPGVEESTPLLRCPGVELITVKASFEGWTLEVDHGIDETDPIALGGCRVDKFRVAPSQGGTVDLMFRIGSNDIDSTEAGLLCSHLSHEVSITLKAPEKLPDAIDGTIGHPGAAGESEGDATDMFTAEHGGGEPSTTAIGSEFTDPGGDEQHSAEPFDSREAELQAEAATSVVNFASTRTARGRERTKKALADGFASVK